MNSIEQIQTHLAINSATGLINHALQAWEGGDWDGARRLSLEATRQDPGNIEAWLVRARTAGYIQERLFCLSQASRLKPDHPIAKHALYTTLWVVLKSDPYLAYIEETDQVYYVGNREYLALAVPKDRGVPESYPPERHPMLARAYRYLVWSFVSLALAGFGTMIFAPLAAHQAASALSQPLQKNDRIRAGLILKLSILVSAIALFLMWLFIAHFSS